MAKSRKTTTPKKIIHEGSYATDQERAAYDTLLDLSRRSPLPHKDILANTGLHTVRITFARMQFMYQLYLKALRTHGVIMEFGVRWGNNLALMTTFRTIHEPYNLSRRIIGFDTWKGFPSVRREDGTAHAAQVGALGVTPGYETYLSELLTAHEQLAPRSNIKKHELVKGNVMETLPKYLKDHPETIIALAYFDMDLYEPTKKCLELIRPHLVKNSVVGFDELALAEFPGETQALREAWGIENFAIHRDPISPQQSYIVVGE